MAVTQGPGLIGALLVGLSTGKALAYARGLPLVPVDHLLGHVAALRLAPLALEPPFACLLASGGHTLVLDVADYAAPRRLGGTRDDAAGEAFDKGARLLGLSEAGGAALERVAREGDPARFPFPPVLRGQAGHDLSFSGLKTALAAARARARRRARATRAPISPRATRRRSCGSSPSAPRPRSTPRAARRSPSSAAWPPTARCAPRSPRSASARGARLCLLPPALCVDNAAMIGAAALRGARARAGRVPRARRLRAQPARGLTRRERQRL